LRVVPVCAGQAHGERGRPARRKSDGACFRAWRRRSSSASAQTAAFSVLVFFGRAIMGSFVWQRNGVLGDLGDRQALSLQWRDVSLERRELTIRAEKAKTRTERIVPISTRLLATPEMRTLDPAGKEFETDAYVFGNEVGGKVKSVRIAWEAARTRQGWSACKPATCGTKPARDSTRPEFRRTMCQRSLDTRT
jgi:hypothetical protein